MRTRRGCRRAPRARGRGAAHARPRTVIRVQRPSVTRRPRAAGRRVPGGTSCPFTCVPLVEARSCSATPPSGSRTNLRVPARRARIVERHLGVDGAGLVVAADEHVGLVDGQDDFGRVDAGRGARDRDRCRARGRRRRRAPRRGRARGPRRRRAARGPPAARRGGRGCGRRAAARAAARGSRSGRPRRSARRVLARLAAGGAGRGQAGRSLTAPSAGMGMARARGGRRRDPGRIGAPQTEQ